MLTVTQTIVEICLCIPLCACAVALVRIACHNTAIGADRIRADKPAPRMRPGIDWQTAAYLTFYDDSALTRP
jgi:hypothetical protein